MTGAPGPADLAVVIPTRDRWDILAATLDGLARQEVTGFSVVVVVDGLDQRPPALPGVQVLQVAHGGPGAARNAGVAVAERPYVLFLGDDMVPDPGLVGAHLAAHAQHGDPAGAVLGRVEWHPDVAGGRCQRWMDAAAVQFDVDGLGDGDDAGWGRFYSCNVSLPVALLEAAGGFDPGFRYYYEDLDCGYRLGRAGMTLRYRPAALTRHLHAYDLDGLRRRLRGVGEGEFHMAATHPWFRPHFLDQLGPAAQAPPASAVWPRVAGAVPAALPRLRRRAAQRADTWYRQQLWGPFAEGWAAAAELAELRAYLGPAYRHELLERHQQVVDDERAAAPDEDTFYRTSRHYLYDLTAFAMSGTKAPYLAELRAVVPPGASALDYGCGIGADGLRLAAGGYRMAFCDYANPSTEYLRWRLARRGLDAPVYDLDHDEVPGGFDLAYSFDVIEHVADPFAFLDALERRAAVVAVNLLEEEPDDTDLHHPLPIGALLDHAAARGLLRYRRYHGRSHLVVYRSGGRGGWRSQLQRRLGAHLPGRPGWHPDPVRPAAEPRPAPRPAPALR